VISAVRLTGQICQEAVRVGYIKSGLRNSLAAHFFVFTLMLAATDYGHPGLEIALFYFLLEVVNG
jgi:hypothetical protein